MMRFPTQIMKCLLTLSLTILYLILLSPVFAQSSGDLLEDLTRPADYSVKRVSSYDQTGGNRDALVDIKPGETRVLADIEGPGMITHIWFTLSSSEPFVGRKIVLRMYWDHEEQPSVLTPLNDFFCMGHGLDANVNSMPIVTTARGRARNCFFKMPFNKHARIEIVNEGLQPLYAFYYYVDYRVYRRSFKPLLAFHAQYRQAYPPKSGSDYQVASIEGRGNYVGTLLSYESHFDGWWGEGDDKFYIDGEDFPSLHGTGTEDYLNDAWGVWEGNSLFYGSPIRETGEKSYAKGTRYSCYRFHIADPIPFKKSLRFELEHYGVGMIDGKESGYAERFDNLSSVAYWYQSEPHKPFAPLVPVEERLPDTGESEKPILKFKRLSRLPLNPENLAEMKSIFEKLTVNSDISTTLIKLYTDYALALIKSGNRDDTKQLLSFTNFPLLPQSIAETEELQPVIAKRIAADRPLLVDKGNGSLRRVKYDDRIGFSTDKDDNRNYMYFRMPGSSPLRDNTCNCVLKIEYFSQGIEDATDPFYFQYHDAGIDGKEENRYRETEPIDRAAQRGWHTVEIPLPRAKFDGSQYNQADFRLSARNSKHDVVIRSVVVSRQS